MAMRRLSVFDAAADYLLELRDVHGWSEADIREVAKQVARELLVRARPNE